MPEASRGLLFRKRNILGAALVAGIGLGIYLGQNPFKGLGGGNNVGIGVNDAKTPPPIDAKTQDANDAKTPAIKGEPTLVTTESQGKLPVTVPDVVKVLIDEHEFLLRRSTEDVPITLGNLIYLVKQAPGDSDGFRVRIYEKSTARASAEEKLKQALVEAGIPDSAVLWVPTSVKDIDRRSEKK